MDWVKLRRWTDDAATNIWAKDGDLDPATRSDGKTEDAPPQDSDDDLISDEDDDDDL